MFQVLQIVVVFQMVQQVGHNQNLILQIAPSKIKSVY